MSKINRSTALCKCSWGDDTAVKSQQCTNRIKSKWRSKRRRMWWGSTTWCRRWKNRANKKQHDKWYLCTDIGLWTGASCHHIDDHITEATLIKFNIMYIIVIRSVVVFSSVSIYLLLSAHHPSIDNFWEMYYFRLLRRTKSNSNLNLYWNPDSSSKYFILFSVSWDYLNDSIKMSHKVSNHQHSKATIVAPRHTSTTRHSQWLRGRNEGGIHRGSDTIQQCWLSAT